MRIPEAHFAEAFAVLLAACHVELLHSGVAFYLSKGPESIFHSC